MTYRAAINQGRPAPQPLVRCVFGMRGSGKSTLARQLVAEAPRLLVHDPMREHDCLHLELDAFAEFFERSPLDRFRVGLCELGAEEEFCAWAWVLGQRVPAHQLTILLEEADLVAPPGRETPIFRKLIAQGRHYGIAPVAVSRRPAEVSRYLTAQAHELYVFRSQEPKDLTYLRAFIGAEATERVAAFERFEYVRWTDSGWTVGHVEQLAVPGGPAPNFIDKSSG
jgi:hypothetical protein